MAAHALHLCGSGQAVETRRAASAAIAQARLLPRDPGPVVAAAQAAYLGLRGGLLLLGPASRRVGQRERWELRALGALLLDASLTLGAAAVRGKVGGAALGAGVRLAVTVAAFDLLFARLVPRRSGRQLAHAAAGAGMGLGWAFIFVRRLRPPAPLPAFA